MGFSGISMPSLLLIALIVVLLFGTKKLRNLGGDLGSAVKGFKNAMSSEDEKKLASEQEDSKKALEDNSQQSESVESEKEQTKQ